MNYQGIPDDGFNRRWRNPFGDGQSAKRILELSARIQLQAYSVNSCAKMRAVGTYGKTFNYKKIVILSYV